MNGLFITGTDTGIGKTTVGAAFVRAVVASGVRVRALKPIESGCETDAAGELVPADALKLRAASSVPDAPLSEIIRYRLAEPVAPAVAAEREQVEIDVDECLALVERARADADFVTVEGAGGLLVPFAGTAATGYVTVADFAARVGFPVLVVARARLGTINHTLLTVRELERRNLACAGVILNDADGDAKTEVETNAAVLRSFGVNVLAEVPHDVSGSVSSEFFFNVWKSLS